MRVGDCSGQLLFVYGTLQDERVIRAVTGRIFQQVPATLHEYARYRVQDADYPGIRQQAGSRVDGLLLREVDGAAMMALDAFEGDLYERRQVQITTQVGDTCVCSCYVVREGSYHLLTTEPWQLEEFQRVGYQRFRDTYPHF